MPDRKHIQSIEGQPAPADIFQPHLMGVELFEDMDEVFEDARRVSAGQHPDHEASHLQMVQGQRAVAILTPGRLIMVDPTAPPNSLPEEKAASMLELLPPDPPLKISVISYTFVPALATDMDKAIPFRGYLLAFAYAGHNVIVFEGHPSAFDSGVRNADILLMDSGMLPFVQFNWVNAALRVMRPEGKIFIHDRPTYTLKEVVRTPEGQALAANAEADYAEFLLRALMRSVRRTVEITAGEAVPDLVDFSKEQSDRDWVTKNIDRNQVNADKLIDLLLQKAGWRWYTPFKTTARMKFPVQLADGTIGKWIYTFTLRKTSNGKRQLLIER